MEDNNTIQCVGFIMDGNRRWAKAHNLPSLEGHARGYKTFKEMIRVVNEAKIPHMVCYAFSTENWKRAEKEVSYLMQLLEQGIKDFIHESTKGEKRINLRIIGQTDRLPETLQVVLHHAESKNHSEAELTVWIALSYGGRAEIVEAVNRVMLSGEKVTEDTFSNFLWTAGMPDPDLIIRTSGEIRTSNFLLWQSAYSELFFTETLWPDFGETEFQSILEEYGKRQRRRGT